MAGMTKKKKKTGPKTRNSGKPTLYGRLWNDDYYVKAYELARTGMKDCDIYRVIGVSKKRWEKWLSTKPSLRNALRLARSLNPGVSSDDQKSRLLKPTAETFREYAFRRLPPDLAEYWEKLCEAEKAEDGSAEKLLEALTRNKGLYARQYLWIHAFVTSNFNAAEASRRLNIPYTDYKMWAQNDPDFGEMLRHLTGDVRKDWIEGCLMDLVAMRDTAATIFTAKTQLADRGYNPSKKIEMSGQTDVNIRLQNAIDISEVLEYVSIESRREILEAVGRMREGKLPVKEVKAIDE